MVSAIYKIPKISVDYAQVDKFLKKEQKKNLVKVTLPVRKRATTNPPAPILEFQIYKEISALAISQFLDSAYTAAIVHNDQGVFTVNQTGLAALLHGFLIENFTSLPLPDASAAKDDGTQTLDLNAVITLGEYLLGTVDVYRSLYDRMMESVKKDLEAYAFSLNQLCVGVTIAAADVQNVVRQPQVLNLIKEQLRESDTGGGQ